MTAHRYQGWTRRPGLAIRGSAILHPPAPLTSVWPNWLIVSRRDSIAAGMPLHIGVTGEGTCLRRGRVPFIIIRPHEPTRDGERGHHRRRRGRLLDRLPPGPSRAP